MKILTTLLAVFCVMPALSHGAFRIQHYTPELRWMSLEETKPEQVEAAIVAPRGLSCNLPSKDGYCTIPLTWLSNQDNPSSLWRTHNGLRLKVAQGYDGQVNATLRYGQVIRYDILSGTADGGKMLDSADLTALWDDSWVTNPPVPGMSGNLVIDHGGSCQIYTDQSYCTLRAEWTTTGVQKVSLWQRTPSELRLVYEGAPEDSVQVGAYEHGAVYELREGNASDGEFLAAGTTRGYRVEPAGEISLPDGDSCTISDPKGKCQLRVSWDSNDMSRLWMREQSSSGVALKGQSLIEVTANGVIVDLRAGSQATGNLLDRASLSSVLVDNAGRISSDGPTGCEIPYSDSYCNQPIQYSIDKGIGTLWNEQGNIVAQGSNGKLNVQATEYGVAYHLRAGEDISNPILSTYIARGVRQSYRGSLQLSGPDTCTFNYQGGFCNISLAYEATDKASIWESGYTTPVVGGQMQGIASVQLNDRTGENEGFYSFDLKIHGNYSPKMSDPVLASVVLKGIQPTHTGTLTAPSGAVCNLLYGRSSCTIDIAISTTATSASVWNDEDGALVAYVNNGTGGFRLSVPEGSRQYTLREGTKSTNKVLSSIDLTAYRPTYFAQLTFPSGTECNVSMSNQNCTLPFKLNSNTSTRLRVRDVTTNPNAPWVVAATGFGSNASSSYSVSNITANKTYEFSIEQNSSPYMQLDVATVQYRINEQHGFQLTSVLPQPGSGIQCRGEWSTTRVSNCRSTTPIVWETTSPGITVCRQRVDIGGNYSPCLYSDTKSTNFGEYWSVTDTQYRLDFYEGNVSPTNPSDAINKGYRLLESLLYTPARKVSVEEELLMFTATEGSCELVDIDATTCAISIPIRSLRFTDPVHQTSAGSGFNRDYYVSKNGVDLTGNRTGYGDPAMTIGFTVYRDQDNVFDLRLQGANSKSDSDPIVSTFVAGTYYRDVSGHVHARRVNTSQTTYNYAYHSNGDLYPHFFARAYNTGTYANEAEPCLLQALESTCRMHIGATVNPGSKASVFVNGEYLISFTSNRAAFQDSNMTVNLPIGNHIISLHEGSGESSIGNKKLDEFSIEVKRPVYAGSIKAAKTSAALPYPEAMESIRFDISTNTRAFVYNLSTGEKVYTLAPNYGADDRFIVSVSPSFSLGEGDHVLELRTHEDRADPANVILGQERVNIVVLPQEMSIRESTSNPQFYTECRLSYQSKNCHIHFSYINSRAESSSNSITGCVVSNAGVVSKGSAHAARTTYGNALTRIIEDTKRVDFYYGPTCPSEESNPEGLILLASHEVVATPVELGVDIQIVKNGTSAANVYKSGEPDTWICRQRYQGDPCAHIVHVQSNPSYIAGQPVNAYYGLFHGTSPSLLSLYSLSNADYESFSANRSFSGENYYYAVHVCNTNNASSGNCPYNLDQRVTSFKVTKYLPDFVTSLTAPNGVHCMSNHGATSCSLDLKVESESRMVTLYADGVARETFSVSSGGVSSTTTQTFTTKAKGVPTSLEIRDGSTSTNRVLAVLDIYPEVFDSAIFKFTSPIITSSSRLEDFCALSLLIPNENPEACVYTLTYESDASEKYVKSSSVTMLDKDTASGNGSIQATYPVTLSALIRTYFANSGGNSIPVSVAAYTDPTYKNKADKVFAGYRIMQYSDNTFTSPTGGSTSRINPGFTSSSGSYYYLNNTGNSIIINSLNVDDITLTKPSGCYTTTSSVPYPYYCSVIDYMSSSLRVSNGTIGVISTSSAANDKIKRVFYRKAPSSSDLTKFSDATVTVNGIARPLNMDGKWHYIDVGDQENITVDFSVVNTSGSSATFGVDVFAEYYFGKIQ